MRRYPEDYIGVLPPSGLTSLPDLSVMWDSTHFRDGTPITVTIELHDAAGKSYAASMSAPAYNKLLALGNQTFGNDTAVESVDAVRDAAEGTGYSLVTAFNHDDVTITSKDSPLYTAFYIDTHGGVGNFNDCITPFPPPTPDQAGNGEVDADVIGRYIAQKGPDKLNLPPYNFAMFDACIVMGDKFDHPDQPDDASMATAFGLANGVDRAALGWDWYTLVNDANAQWTKRLWDFLAQGAPLRQATLLANIDGAEQGETHLPPTFLFQPFYTDVNPVIQGDSAMTLHGVYGGNHSEDTPPAFAPDWYRPL